MDEGLAVGSRSSVSKVGGLGSCGEAATLVPQPDTPIQGGNVTLDDAEFRTHVQPPRDPWMGGGQTRDPQSQSGFGRESGRTSANREPRSVRS